VQIGMVGLGKMGESMARRILQGGHAAGARTAIVTTAGAAPLDDIADLRVDLPIGANAVQSCQHGGSLFEQSSLVLFDAVCALLQADLGRSNAQLTARHANLQ
jgi:6-phospho-3-hexuloisomerase